MCREKYRSLSNSCKLQVPEVQTLGDTDLPGKGFSTYQKKEEIQKDNRRVTPKSTDEMYVDPWITGVGDVR